MISMRHLELIFSVKMSVPVAQACNMLALSLESKNLLHGLLPITADYTHLVPRLVMPIRHHKYDREHR